MKKKTIIGNWKMHGDLNKNKHFFCELLQNQNFYELIRLAICVPFPYLAQANNFLSNSSVLFGAQDVSHFSYGAYTGDISSTMLKDFGCHYVIVGHSERRRYHHENDELVIEKAKSALIHQITPVICIGETQQEYDSQQTFSIIKKQLKIILNSLKEKTLHCVLAYEPIWSIGTGRIANIEHIKNIYQELRLQIKKFDTELSDRITILYGGSLNQENAEKIFSISEIDGGLIGGASLIARDFLNLCRILSLTK